VWHGRLAAELGLTGVVGPDQLRALLLGRDPITDMELLAAKGRPRTITAYDVTFSAPKWVSLLWAFASPEVAAVASIAPMEAVAAALDLLERRAGATRQQTDGVRQRIPTGVGGPPSQLGAPCSDRRFRRMPRAQRPYGLPFWRGPYRRLRAVRRGPGAPVRCPPLPRVSGSVPVTRRSSRDHRGRCAMSHRRVWSRPRFLRQTW
jgi:hypothetical protein